MATELASIRARLNHSQPADNTPHERAPRSCYEKVKDFFSFVCDPPPYPPPPLTNKQVKQLRSDGCSLLATGLGCGGLLSYGLIAVAFSNDQQSTAITVAVSIVDCGVLSLAFIGGHLLTRLHKSPRQDDLLPLLPAPDTPEENL